MSADERVHLHWFLPTTGDSRGIAPDGPSHRPPDLDHLLDVARAAEGNGFESVLTPTGSFCEDAWISAAALLQQTSRLKFLIAFRPGLVAPPLAAQMAATFQRHSGDRLLVNVVTGGDDDEQQAYGDFLDKDARYRRTGEFLDVVKGCWAGRPFSHEGEFFRVRDGGLPAPISKAPTIFFGGASPAAEQVAARHADVQLFFGETPPMVAERIGRLRELAAQHGRSPSFGIRLHVVNRDTSREAWAEADRLLDLLSDERIAAAQAQFRRSQAVGQHRILSLHDGTKHDRAALQIYPNVWAGTGLVMGGGGTALVGSHEEVADRIREYRSVGIEHFVLSGYPKLESAYWFGEGVAPLLERTSPVRHLAQAGVS